MPAPTSAFEQLKPASKDRLETWLHAPLVGHPGASTRLSARARPHFSTVSRVLRPHASPSGTSDQLETMTLTLTLAGRPRHTVPAWPLSAFTPGGLDCCASKESQ